MRRLTYCAWASKTFDCKYVPWGCTALKLPSLGGRAVTTSGIAVCTVNVVGCVNCLYGHVLPDTYREATNKLHKLLTPPDQQSKDGKGERRIMRLKRRKNR